MSSNVRLARTIVGTLALVASSAGAQTISASGNPDPLTISTAIPGAEPTAVSIGGTTYSVTTSAANQKIVARLNTALPSGVTLTLTLGAPSGATSAGPISLTTSDQEVVGAIGTPNTYTGLAISYTLSATVAASTVSTTVRTVVITVVNGPETP